MLQVIVYPALILKQGFDMPACMQLWVCRSRLAAEDSKLVALSLSALTAHPSPLKLGDLQIIFYTSLRFLQVHSTLDGSDAADFKFTVKFNSREHSVAVRQRPFLFEFLERVAQLFEVVVFTASQKVYAEQLLNILDPTR